MNVSVVGGGPAGLYSALLIKKSDPACRVRVIEKNPEGATYGWGVVFSDRTLSSFREADIRSYERIMDALVIWDRIEIRYGGETIRVGEQVFSGISRKSLLAGLVARCRELGVEIEFEREVEDPDELAGDDLVIAADGVHSIFRSSREGTFGTRLERGKARYIWFGTDYTFDCFTFMFESNDDGSFQVHAYPFDGTRGTFIVETDERTWKRAGLDRATEAESISYCETLFAKHLAGARLMSNQSKWISFPTLRNRRWVSGRVALMGDAAHTAHFSIGSGTKLAMEDAITLANSLESKDEVEAALADYQLERKPRVERFQDAAKQSQTYFENTRRYLHLAPIQFAFHLMTRSGRVDYADLRRADPRFVSSVDRWFAGGDSRTAIAAPPPAVMPVELGTAVAANRVVLTTRPTEDSAGGVPSEAMLRELSEAVRQSPGLVLTETLAVSAHGRFSPATPGLYGADGVAAFTAALDAAKGEGSDALIGAVLGHSGPRGSMRPRHRGADHPLREGAWRTLAASAVPYARGAPVPAEVDRRRFRAVKVDFVSAAEGAGEAGFEALFLDMAGGGLLASFLSPLTNRRGDGYGGDAAGRRRYPLEVFEAVREAWPSDRLLGVSLSAHDGRRGGVSIAEVTDTARILAERGCGAVLVRTGGTVQRGLPRYDLFDQMTIADRIRNGAGVPVIASGRISVIDQVNTIVAGGRADMCVLLR